MTKKNIETAPFVDLQNLWRSANVAIESRVDPVGMATPLLHAQMAWFSHPQELSSALLSLTQKILRLQQHSWRRALGVRGEDVVKPNPDDTRFVDPIWTDSPTWDITKEWYLTVTRHIQDMLYETPGMSNKDKRRAAFWWRKWLNAVAPTNFLLSNPVALRLAAETNGKSLVEGVRNFFDDLEAGTIRMTSTDEFEVGKNLATTPGKVVFRNRLLELIHYTPTAPQVHRVPLVFVVPWINKFYILDLNARKSMVKFLLDQGFDVYITSWKNPDASMRDVGFDSYLTEGLDQAFNVAREISGSRQVNAVGYCIGGAALATYMAWANRHYGKEAMPVASATFFTTLVDYHKPGDIEVFLDEGTVSWLEKSMEKKGFLDGKEMAASFRLLRSNSLIWHYVVHGYLYGEKPPAFDILYWNMDTTRMPATMHGWYLREFYLENKLIKKNALTLAGEAIDLEQIDQPIYAVAAEDDHIAPWHQAFRINNFATGDKRFVLSSSGHILGIVNPVVTPPKREYWVGATERHHTPDSWRGGAEHRKGSWWEDWVVWLRLRSGDKGESPIVETKAYPALGDAPGTYVLED